MTMVWFWDIFFKTVYDVLNSKNTYGIFVIWESLYYQYKVIHKQCGHVLLCQISTLLHKAYLVKLGNQSVKKNYPRGSWMTHMIFPQMGCRGIIPFLAPYYPMVKSCIIKTAFFSCHKKRWSKRNRFFNGATKAGPGLQVNAR